MSNIAEKLVQIANKEAENIELNNQLSAIISGVGEKPTLYYDEFWDGVQRNGARKQYQYGFLNWGFEYIHPKYKVVPTDGHVSQMFATNIYLKKIEKKYFDFSQVPKATYTSIGNYYTFSNCYALEEIEDIGLQGDFYHSTFSNCRSLHTIEILRFHENTVANLSIFADCKSLKNITIEGVIATDFDIQWSTLLSKASIESIVGALSKTTGATLTLSLEAVNREFETSVGAADGSTSDEWIETIRDKSNEYDGLWTISLV